MRKCGRILRFLCMKCIEKSQKFWYNYIKKEKNCGHARCFAERTGFPHMLLLIGLVVYLDIGFLIYHSLVKKRIVGDSWTGYLVFLLWPFVVIIWGLEFIDGLFRRKG